MKNLSTQIVRIFLGILLVAQVVSLKAQDRDETVSINTDLVLINVLVMDRSVKPVRRLVEGNFELYIDDIKQPIENFSSDADAVSFGIVYDMHPTTLDSTKAVINSLRGFKAKLASDDDIFLTAFDSRGLQAFDFIPTVDQLEKHMTTPGKREVRSLYDAVYFSCEKMGTTRNRKKVLVIISDSADHNSRHRLNEIRNKAAQIKAEIYAIIPDSSNRPIFSDMARQRENFPPFTRDASPLDRAALMELTLRNGGGTFFSGAESAYQLAKIYDQIADEMRGSYTLGFYPASTDSKTHSIKVKLKNVKDDKDYILTYRMSYQADAKRKEGVQ